MNQYRESGSLPIVAPFDFSKTLNFVSNFYPMMGEQAIDVHRLTKAVRIMGHTIGFRLFESDGKVRYELYSDVPLPAEVHQAAADRISFFFSLTDDMTPFYAIGQADPCFAPVIQELYGMHHVKFLTLCEIACWAILTQHTAIPIARKAKQALVNAYGHSITIEGQEFQAFPEFADLTNVSVEELAELVGNERKAQYLYDVVQTLKDVDETWLRCGPYSEVESLLRAIRGIGAWSASFIMLRGLGRMERMPLDMKAFQKALSTVYGNGAAMTKIVEPYGQLIGYWGLYLRAAAGRYARTAR